MHPTADTRVVIISNRPGRRVMPGVGRPGISMGGESMELTFYDQNGQPYCYTVDGEHLYTFGGTPIAYLHGDSVYSFGGKHLGWFANGWIYDASGRCLLFSEVATGGPGRPGKAGKPGKAGRAGRPGKGGRQGRPGRPGLSSSWSNIAPQSFFSHA
jgi:hypothetical protein